MTGRNLSFFRLLVLYLEEASLMEFIRVNGLDSLHPSRYGSRFEYNCGSDHIQRITAGDLGIDSIPPSFASFGFAKDIGLQHNDLKSLPIEITELEPRLLSIGWNRLCAVPDVVSRWLDTHDPLWRETQDCPT